MARRVFWVEMLLLISLEEQVLKLVLEPGRKKRYILKLYHWVSCKKKFSVANQ